MNHNIEDIIAKAEANLQAAPTGFAAEVMRRLPQAVPSKVPVLSKRLCAAVCFSSAAAILLLTLFDRQVLGFISERSGRLNEMFTFVQNINITIGG